MGTMDKFLNFMKLGSEADDDDFYDDDYSDDEEDIAPAPRKFTSAKAKAVKEEPEYDEEPQPRKTVQPKVTPIRQTRKVSSNGMEVCIIKPVSMEDARDITDTLLANRTVVLNLEGLDMDVAQRIIDFALGSCIALSGKLQQISHYIFIITPASVDVSGDYQSIFNGSFEMPMNNGL